jgi:hypothetical protein
VKTYWKHDIAPNVMVNSLVRQRTIVLYARAGTEFTAGAKYIYYDSKLQSGDCHNDMSSKNYKKCSEEKIIPNIVW